MPNTIVINGNNYNLNEEFSTFHDKLKGELDRHKIMRVLAGEELITVRAKYRKVYRADEAPSFYFEEDNLSLPVRFRFLGGTENQINTISISDKDGDILLSAVLHMRDDHDPQMYGECVRAFGKRIYDMDQEFLSEDRLLRRNRAEIFYLEKLIKNK